MKVPMNAQLMNPQLMSTAVTPQGGSVHQQTGMMPAQANSFARANLVTTATQGTAGTMESVRGMQQQFSTADHQAATAGLNFAPGVDSEVAARNQQKAKAQRLSALYRSGIIANGPVPLRGPNGDSAMRLLGEALNRR